MDYNKYATAINKIFESINKMKTAWDNPDNLNYISKIEEYKEIVIEQSKIIQTLDNTPSNPTEMEELGQ